jgi:hypothetical protein
VIQKHEDESKGKGGKETGTTFSNVRFAMEIGKVAFWTIPELGDLVGSLHCH